VLPLLLFTEGDTSNRNCTARRFEFMGGKKIARGTVAKIIRSIVAYGAAEKSIFSRSILPAILFPILFCCRLSLG